MSQHFEASFDSLRTYSAPEWFRDAKFGIWSHWGPQSVPMFGDWYARNMYIEGTPQYEYHLRHYGHPSKFGYKDICALWKAEKFAPDALMAKYYKAGARYLMTQGTHHDHFFNYDSKLNRMNSVNVGPKKDILELWKAAADQYGLRFGISEHLGASFSWWRVNKGCDKYGPYAGVPYDGNDPAYRDFYHANEEHGTENPGDFSPWYTGNKAYRDYWLRCVNEMIDRFQPDLLYSDGVLPFGEHWLDNQKEIDEKDYELGLKAVARLYNTSIDLHGENQAVYLQKDRRKEIFSVGVLDILQLPDGSIDDEAAFILDKLAEWFAVNSEAVYGTRPWRVFGEGETRVKIDGFTEEKTDWNRSDFRFVQKDGAVYAFALGVAPGETIVLRSFAEQEVRSVELLGAGPVEFRQEFGVLAVQLPEKLPSICANALRIK